MTERLMKDSGIEWIGKIPDKWKMNRLKNILAERNEKNDPIITNNILSLGLNYGVIPYSEREIAGGNKAKEDLSAYKIARPNDIVMNSMNVISGSVGISNYFGCVSPVYYMFYPRSSEINIKYYNLIFQSKAFQRSLLGLGNGIMMKENDEGNFNTVRMRIPLSKLNDVRLPIPSYEEQTKIANFLDKKVSEIDNAIEKTKQSIEEYKKLKQSIITEAVTKGLNPDAEKKDSGYEHIGYIPAGWKLCKVRNIGTTQNGISKGSEYFGDGDPFVSYGDVYRNMELPTEVTGKIRSTDDEKNSYSVKRGDVFFTRTSETIEEVGFTSVCLKDIDDACFAGFLIRLRPTVDWLTPEYSKYYFRSEHHRQFIVKEMNLVTRASLSQDLLKDLPVLVPTKEEQKQISCYLDAKCTLLERLIASKEKTITELEQYKKSLIYEYVTGKKEVA